jgi:uncharacterized protein YbjQ (UPF0145 family)
MSKSITLISSLIILLQGCVVSPSLESEKVRIVTSDKGCKYVSTVTGSGSVGWTTAHDAEGAMNEVRNRAAEDGANAIQIINIDSDALTSVVVALALECDFSEDGKK